MPEQAQRTTPFRLAAEWLQGFGNTIALGLHDLAEIAQDAAETVVQDAQGVPIAWRLFAFRPFTITRSGETMKGEFTEAAADAIIAHFRQKGERVPLDSKHFLFRLAQKHGVSEAEVLNLIPDGRGTFGFANLEKRGDGLWVVDVEYVPLAYQLMAEGIFRYFSPVVRGLSDGKLRITSVAFTNIPAIDDLDALAASAEEPAITDMNSLAASLDTVAGSAAVNSRTAPNQGEKNVKKLLTAIGTLLGMTDAIALSDDGDAPDSIVDQLVTLSGEITDLRALKGTQEAFLGKARDALALGAEADLGAVEGAILGLKAKGAQADTLKTQVDALVLEGETRKRQEVIDRGVAEGKLTPVMVENWCKDQDAAALSAFLEHAPVIVAPGTVVDRSKLPGPDAIALTAEDKQVGAELGYTEEQMLAQKKEMFGKK